MDGDNLGYVPDLPSYDPNIDFGTSTSDYWPQSFAQQHDPQPTHSAPFFEGQQDIYLTGNDYKSSSMFTFTGGHTESYRSFPASTMQSYTPSNNQEQRPQTGFTESPRLPPPKRQRMSQDNHDTRVAGTTVQESDRASLCGTESECCSSCSGGIPCDEPDCSPCDEANCVGAAVEVCSIASCSKPACRDECLSTAFQSQSLLGNVAESSKGMSTNLEQPPWSAQANQGMDQFRPPASKVDTAIVQPSPATTPSMAHHGETPESSYPALSTPQNNLFEQQASYSSPIMGELSGTGAMFQSSSEQWTDNSYGATPEVLPCGWESCDFVCMSHEEWVSHFHSAHIDTQMQFGCPVPADDCPSTLDANPFDHLQTVHGYEYDFSSGTFSCPATTCPPEQTYGSPRMFHDHLDHYHATPVQGSLQCRLQTCGTVFDDPNQFFSHMTDHLQGSFPKTEEIELVAPPTSANADLSEPGSKAENSDLASLAHVCMWRRLKEGNLCHYEGTSAADLQDHVKDQHLSSLGKSTGYLCQWEGCRRDSILGEKSGFSQRGKLERHMATHTGFKCSVCPTCGQFFSAPQALRQHILLHTGEKPWKCKHCDKRFPQQSACTIHERTHTNEKPLECNICGKKFSESSNLAKHRKIHGEKGLHACPVSGCGKSFHRLDQLKRHALTHDKQAKDSSKKRASRKQKLNGAMADDLEENIKTGFEGESRL